MKPAETLDGSVLDGKAEVIQLNLLLLLELHLDEGCLVLVLRQDDVVPFVLEVFELELVRVVQRMHFFFLGEARGRVRLACQGSSLHVSRTFLLSASLLQRCEAP